MIEMNGNGHVVDIHSNGNVGTSSGTRNGHYQAYISNGGTPIGTPRRIRPLPSRHETGEDEAPVNRMLPKELLLRIFSYLDVVSLCRCGQVSKYWNEMALDGSNWQRIDLFRFQIDIQPSVVENISQRCGGFLKSLSLRGCQNITDHALQTFAAHCPNIEVINLENCKHISDSSIEAIGNLCGRLVYLDVNSCPALTDVSMRAVGAGCPYLEHLNISWCERITNDGLAYIAHGCPRLRALICKGCSHITDSVFIAVATNCPDLEVVNLHSCHSINDRSIEALASRCLNLQSLCVSACQALTDISLVALGRYSTALRTLECSGCSLFTDVGVQALSRTCHQLERLDLEECSQLTDLSLSYLAANCTQISRLSLSHCEQITDDGIRHLGSSPFVSEHLNVLELDNCPLGRLGLTDMSLQHLTSCHGLERVDLYDCQLITRSGIKRIKHHLPSVKVQAYFAPGTPPQPGAHQGQRRYCRCCVIV